MASAASASSSQVNVRKRTGTFPASWPYRPRDMTRMDEDADSTFYSMPRFVTHIDDRCIDALSKYYGEVLPQPSTSNDARKPRIIDLASSWISHLPEDWTPDNVEVLGVGMNEAELAKNRALTNHLVLDLNEHPEGLSQALLGNKEGNYDAAICSVSIDYVTNPREVLADLAGLLHEGASVHLAFSNRCFPSKVVGRWLRISEEERCDMVADYFHFAGTSTGSGDSGKTAVAPGQLYNNVEIVTVLKASWSGDPLYVVRATRQ